MKEMVKVVSSLIEELKRINHNIANVEFLIDSYFEWKDEKGDIKRMIGCNNLLKELTGIKAETDIKDGLNLMIKALEANKYFE